MHHLKPHPGSSESELRIPEDLYAIQVWEALITVNGLSQSLSSSLTFFFFFVFLGPHLWHMEVPRPGVQSEL